MDKKSKYKELEEKISRRRRCAWNDFSRAQHKELDDLCKEYMKMISECKNERQFVAETIETAKKHGFKPLESFKSPKAGDKIYLANRGKNVVLAVVGKKGVKEGLNIVASHVDSPRLDLKPNPLIEDRESSTAIFKTHYYGGIKKYQWTQRPMAIIGVVALKDGSTVNINIGDGENDPVFVIPDLLPHLAARVQGDLKTPDVIRGEQLNLICGSIPVDDESVKEKVKMTVLEKLYDDYGIDENDFVSAELEAVPAGSAREVGLDRSIIAAYGHDDRVCAFANIWALFNMKETPEKTAVVFLADKEEIGSYGATGMDSSFFYHAVSKIADGLEKGCGDMRVRDVLSISSALSTDVSAAVNPNFKEVHEINNAPILGYGVNMLKYTGARGKAGSSDADAEYVAKLRRLFDDEKIAWQLTELGKVDEGGGGTVAFLLARHLIHTIDLGVPLVGMHSPFELASKADIYAAAKACSAFLSKF